MLTSALAMSAQFSSQPTGCMRWRRRLRFVLRLILLWCLVFPLLSLATEAVAKVPVGELEVLVEATGWRKRALSIAVEDWLEQHRKREPEAVSQAENGQVDNLPVNKPALRLILTDDGGEKGRSIGVRMESVDSPGRTLVSSRLDLDAPSDTDALDGLKEPIDQARRLWLGTQGAQSATIEIARQAVFVLALGAIVLLLSPLMLRWSNRPPGPGLPANGRSWWERNPLMLTIAGALLVAALATLLLSPLFQNIQPSVVYLVAGILWGWFAIVTAATWFPPLRGLGRIPHTQVFDLLATWAWVVLGRVFGWAASHVPPIVVGSVVASALGVSIRSIVIFVVPGTGLLVRAWWFIVVSESTRILDAQLNAASGTLWEPALCGYLRGYIKRNGWVGGERLLESVRFVAVDKPTALGEFNAVVAYGGGSMGTRVAVDIDLLEFALAPYGRPHDYHAPREDTLFWSGWNAGLVIPTATPQVKAMRTALSHHNEPGEIEFVHLGQPPTLAGFVEPSALDSRHNHRPVEDPTWLDWDPGNDFDGTDPGDHDLLFGVLVHRLGRIDRGEVRTPTVAAALGVYSRKWPAVLKWAAAIFRWPGQFAFSHANRRLGDAMCELHFAKHHWVQYLSWRRWGEDDLLSARAFSPELARHSDQILGALDREGVVGTQEDGLRSDSLQPRQPRAADPDSAPVFGAEKMETLEQFSERLHRILSSSNRRANRQAKSAEGRGKRRWLALACVIALALALLTLEVIRALNYQQPEDSMPLPVAQRAEDPS